jgi:hypothetical protein
MKTAAAKNTLFSFTFKSVSIVGNLLHVPRKRVLTPFPDVPGHVEEAELVRQFLCNIVGVIATLAVIPGHEVNVIAAAITKSVLPVRSTACGRRLGRPNISSGEWAGGKQNGACGETT